MVVAFPAAKLLILFVKQLNKPVANIIQNQAKKSHFFRSYFLIPLGQFSHKVEVKMKMKSFNIASPTQVPDLNENMAIEAGASLVQEGIVFLVMVALLVLEYNRQKRNERAKEAANYQRFQELEDQVIELRYEIVERRAEVSHLCRTVEDLQDRLKISKNKENQTVQTNGDKTLFSKAKSDAVKILNGDLWATQHGTRGLVLNITMKKSLGVQTK